METDTETELNDGMDNFEKRISQIYHKNFCLSNSVDDFNIWEQGLKQIWRNQGSEFRYVNFHRAAFSRHKLGNWQDKVDRIKSAK